MPSFYSTQVNGSAVQYAPVESGPAGPPAVTTFKKEFDGTTNQNVVAQFQLDPQLYQFVGNALFRDGLEVAFAPGATYFEAKARSAPVMEKVRQVLNGTPASFNSEEIAIGIVVAFHADGIPTS